MKGALHGGRAQGYILLMERKKQPLWFRYGLAVFFIALATLVRIGMYAWGGSARLVTSASTPP